MEQEDEWWFPSRDWLGIDAVRCGLQLSAPSHELNQATVRAFAMARGDHLVSSVRASLQALHFLVKSC